MMDDVLDLKAWLVGSADRLICVKFRNCLTSNTLYLIISCIQKEINLRVVIICFFSLVLDLVISTKAIQPTNQPTYRIIFIVSKFSILLFDVFWALLFEFWTRYHVEATRWVGLWRFIAVAMCYFSLYLVWREGVSFIATLTL